MADLQFRFRCYDVADCDVVIYSKLRASIIEAVQSHMKDVHGEVLSEEDVSPFIETV